MRKRRPLPDQKYLLSILDYAPLSGHLYWKYRASARVCVNSRLVDTAGGTKSSSGHTIIGIDGARFLAHRVIWKMIHGTEPDYIDHKNGDPSDNRIINLRECTQQQNARNSVRKNSASKFPRGVRPWKNRFKVRILLGRTEKYIGLFKTLDEASSAYQAAAKKYFGEFARAV